MDHKRFCLSGKIGLPHDIPQLVHKYQSPEFDKGGTDSSLPKLGQSVLALARPYPWVGSWNVLTPVPAYECVD